METLRSVVQANGLVVAFLCVGLSVWLSYWLSRHFTRGRIHGSAIAIILGLLAAYFAGLFTGGSRGVADIGLLAGIGLMGGGMMRDFGIVSTAFGVHLQELRKAGVVGIVSIFAGVIVSFVVGALVALAFGYTDAESITTIGAGAVTYIVGPVTGTAIGASSDVIALAVAAGVVMAAIPAAVAVMSRLFLGERIAPRVGWAIVLAGAGIATLALARAPADAPTKVAPWGGYALLMGAVICEASYVVIGKRLAANVSPQRISALINLWGLALITPFGLWQAWSFDFTRVTPPAWGLLLFYALAASIATVWLWMRGLRQVPASRAGIFTVCLPVSAAAVGVLWLGEPFGMAHGVAIAMSLAGLVLATWPDQARTALAQSSS